jgi:hypothetical protein
MILPFGCSIEDAVRIAGSIAGYPVIRQNRSAQLRCLPPPQRAPCGGLNNQKIHGDFPAIDTPGGQVIQHHRNRRMPTRRGQSPQERQTPLTKRAGSIVSRKTGNSLEHMSGALP